MPAVSRVVSLLPSATESLCLIGGDSLLVGRSHECDYPPSILDRPALTSAAYDPADSHRPPRAADPGEIDRRVSSALAGGRSLYRLDEARLRELRPDLIITQDLCSVCSIDLNTVRAVAAGLAPTPAVLSLNPTSLEDVFDDLLRIGDVAGLSGRARDKVVTLRERFFSAADFVNGFSEPPPLVFLDWVEPLFAAGHWTAQLVERAGAAHPLNPTRPMAGAGAGAGGQMAHRVAGASRRVTREEVQAAEPEFMVVCPCGVGLAEARAHALRLVEQPGWRELPAARHGRVALVDGNHMFNRPGPRLVEAYCWLVGWVNDRPSLVPPSFPWESM